MDTYINVKFSSTISQKEAEKVLSDIDYLYDTYHKLTDRYNKYDDLVNIYYLNEVLKNDEEIVIDSRLAKIIEIGLSYYNETNDLFNIASGNLTEIWKNFIDDCDIVPSNLDVNINISDISLNENKFSKKNNIKIDLGGLAKGYTTELAGSYLESKGITSYIINAGGNVKVGKPYNKETYIIGITNPDNTSDIFTSVNVKELSVVTSGNYQRYCMLDEVNYNHIINPQTKMPSNYVKSVSVISKDSTLADVYSTYLFLLPIDEGLKVVNNNPNIEAIWYVNDKEIIRSDTFDYE